MKYDTDRISIGITCLVPPLSTQSTSNLRRCDSGASAARYVEPDRSVQRNDAQRKIKVVLFANTDWYLFNFRLPLARHLQANGMDVVLLCPPGVYVEKLESEGFRVIVINMERLSVLPWAELDVVRRLLSIYRRERPDVVHHFTIKCVIYGSLAAKLSGVASRINAVAGLGYVFSNNSVYTRLLRPLVKALLRFTLAGRSARLILQNPDDVDRFTREELVAPGQIRLIRGSGVDTRRFNPLRVASPPRPTTVLLATRLLWDKGVKEFVEAARLCRAEGKSIRFLLAGAPDNGNPGSVQQSDVQQWQSEGVIEALGHVSDIAALLLNEVDIVVHPTMYGEGVPRILLEAAAAGLPLIATNLPGCTEIVRHDVTGLLIRPKNACALAAAILKLCEQPELGRRMGAAARALAVGEFDECRVLQTTLKVYAELVPIPVREDAGSVRAVMR